MGDYRDHKSDSANPKAPLAAANPKERRRARVVHRVGVTFFILILVSALLGLLGKGSLSKTIARDPSNRLRAEYFRFVRYQGPVDLKVRVNGQATATGVLRLQLSKGFVDEVEIERIDPEPISQSSGPRFFTYTIRTETNAETEIRVRFASSHFGRLAYDVGLQEGPVLHLRHFSYP